MGTVLTLIGAPVKADGAAAVTRAGAIDVVRQALDAAGHTVGDVTILQDGVAADIAVAGNDVAGVRDTAEAALADAGLAVDAAAQPDGPDRRRRLLVSDMDSTIITCECIDELADYAGVKAEVAAVTERAMRGELDFAEALVARVATLAGLPEGVLARAFSERVRLMPGARTLVATMRAHDARAVLVSGGFTYFTARVAALCGFDDNRANRLEVAGHRLTGQVIPPILGADAKVAALDHYAGLWSGGTGGALAVGDGANDLPMILRAGLGVAYHAKPKVAAAAPVRINHGDLTALLYLQGYHRDTFIAAED
ncbi:phosphoserine phosphatase SerB [Tistrella bauzanensis]|uniref:Phosphoserine phosphatase n=1 Tax=Tistrella bauzanensis TaxID=657419 RepID=A0ABQ1IGM7_9PROT|nr:phosphoserine phosphatase SerB [Tistrella bauzanensis]GGB37554.1 phosphoserine phosphatase SerB [Tistrella bauzanensis]